ncbi:MAG: COG4705 family protein [Mycobacteriales bacterium]
MTSPAGGTQTRPRPTDPSLIGRVWVEPVAPKVPEVIAIFWLVKILTTAGGEVTSDWLKRYGNFGGGGIELALFVIGLFLQFGTRRYRAFSYWWLAFSIAIIGTGIADFLHLDLHLSYLADSLLWAAVLAVIFWLWHRQEGTLSIHSVHSRPREFYYWATVFATFALGTAFGDYTAAVLNLGYLGSGILFAVLIVLPGIAHWKLRLDSVTAFWTSYVLTRPLGASFSDWFSKPRGLTGLNYGNGTTAVVCFVLVAALVGYLAVARPDIQQGVDSAEV